MKFVQLGLMNSLMSHDDDDDVLESNRYKSTWDGSVITDKQINANRPDIILIDHLNSTTYLIDITVPNTHSLINSCKEKINKYQQLAEEIMRLWKQQMVQVIPMIISVTGVIPKCLFDSLKTLDLSKNIYINMQKEVIFRNLPSHKEVYVPVMAIEI
jgi:hypothetical protein